MYITRHALLYLKQTDNIHINYIHQSLSSLINDFYKHLFNSNSSIEVFTEPNDDVFSNHWLSCITFKNSKTHSPEGLRQALLAENIESRPLWKPMHLQPVFEEAPYYGDGTSESLFNNGLCLPSGSNLREESLERIGEAVLKYINL